jgi:hypothetical protein
MTVSEAKKQLKLGERPSSASVAKANAQLGMSGSDRNENYGNEGRGRALTKEQQFARADAEARSPEGVAKRKKQEAEQGLERVTPETAMLPGGSLKVLSAAAKKLASTGKGASGARTPAQQAFDRARMADRLTPARNAPVSTAAKTTAVGKKTSDYRSLAGSAREDAKANQAYDKLKKLSSRGAGKASSKKTKKFDDESNIEFKRGGSVSSASKRGDGIATRGKTNCKMR